MKINKIIAMALAGALLVGCADLDTEPKGSTITEDQKAGVIENNPEMVAASVNAITSNFSIYNKISDTHNDFGYPSIMLFLDSRGIDLVGMDDGYNWFSGCFELNEGAFNTYYNSIVWGTLYNQIYSANAVASLIPEDTEDSTLKFYLAQALAMRAFDYFNLAQVYQFTYEGNTDAPCVPIVTNENALEAGVNGCARSTVGEVYEQITSDINKAIALLDASSFKRADKRYIDAATAYGIRARVNMVMQNWAAAAADAQKAIELSDATPKSFADASKPSFKDMTEEDWMWGIYIAETDRVVTSGIVNWPSHMGSLNYGYASVGAWRRINASLYNMINASDCRKGWFLDASGQSANLNKAQQAYISNEAKAPAFTQVKFAPYKDEIYTSTNACDIPLMRIEEMYLILAEAQAMSGNAGTGKATLETFVKTYRDPQYTTNASSAEAVQNAVWIQRRIELWGEGQSYFDLMRLRKGVDRASTAWASMDADMPTYNYRIEDTKEGERAAIQKVLSGNGGVTGDPINALLYQLPNAEIQANKLINTGDNNLGTPQLVPAN